MLSISGKKFLTAILIGSIIFATGIGTVLASNSGENDIIHGAVQKNNGMLRIVSGPEEVRNSEYYISWNKQGPEGPKGEPGESGSAEDIEEIVATLVASELSDLHGLIDELQNRIVILEQKLGLAPRDAVITYVYNEYITVSYGTPLADIGALLPGQVKVITDEETTEHLTVEWNLESAGYDGDITGTYLFYGTLLPDTENIANPNELQAIAYVTVPAEIWVNLKTDLEHDSEEWYWNHSYDIDISNLPGNTLFQIEIRSGAVQQSPGSGTAVFSYVFESDASGIISFTIPPYTIYDSGYLITVGKYGHDLFASHGGLFMPHLSMQRISNSYVDGDVTLPVYGWNDDYYHVYVTADSDESHEGWQSQSYMVYERGRETSWSAESTGSIYPEMSGTAELRHEHGGGIRLYWEIPGCDWSGNVSSTLDGVGPEGDFIFLMADGYLETELTSYSWPTPWGIYGEASGLVTGSFTVKDSGEPYDTWNITGSYGDGLAGPYNTVAMAGNVYREDTRIGDFTIWLHGGGRDGWTGTATILCQDSDDYILFDWNGYQ